MSSNNSRGGPPTNFEINEIFGDGENTVTRPLWYYLWGSVARLNSIAHKLSNDSNLYHKGWTLVLLSGIFQLLVGSVFEYYAQLTGWLTPDQLLENLGYTMAAFAWVLALYPLSRWVWVFVFRFGTRFADRRIAAATALGFAFSGFSSLIMYLLQAIMLSTGLPGWVPGENLYDQTFTFIIIPTLLPLIIIPGFYYRDALNIDLLLAMVLIFFSFLLVTGISLLPYLAYTTAIQ